MLQLHLAKLTNRLFYLFKKQQDTLTTFMMSRMKNLSKVSQRLDTPDVDNILVISENNHLEFALIYPQFYRQIIAPGSLL